MHSTRECILQLSMISLIEYFAILKVIFSVETYYRVGNSCQPCYEVPYTILVFIFFLTLVLAVVGYNGLTVSVAIKVCILKKNKVLQVIKSSLIYNVVVFKCKIPKMRS